MEADTLIDEEVEKTEVQDMTSTIAETLREINGRTEVKDDAVEKDGKVVEPSTEIEARPIEADPVLEQAPASWKPDAKLKWQGLDPAIRAEIVRREGDYHKSIHEFMPEADFGKSMRSVIEPYRMLIESEGGTPEAAVGDLLRTAAIFRVGTMEQKRQALADIIQRHGVDVGEQLPAQQGTQPYYDPRVDLMLQQQSLREQQQLKDEQYRNQVIAQKWTEEQKDGKLIRPFVGNVYQEMVPWMKDVKVRNPHWSPEQVLQEAYERACWANPEVRATLLAQQQQEAEAKRREESLRRVTEAKKAASVNLPRRGGLPAKAPEGRIEDTIRDTYRQLTG